MMYFAFELPPGGPRGPLVLVIILEIDNLARMQQADPADVKTKQMPLPPAILARRFVDLDIVIAYEDDTERLADFQARHDLPGLISWLERGRRIRPGDLAAHSKLGPGKQQ